MLINFHEIGYSLKDYYRFLLASEHLERRLRQVGAPTSGVGHVLAICQNNIL